jgi:DNA-binding NarL/FixJ family response regulator
MNKFLIVDDHYIFRQGVKKIINDNYGDAVVGEAEEGCGAMAKILAENWNLVILDINLPGRSGIDLLVDIKKACPSLPVLILSMYEENLMALRAIKAGARGYLTKSIVANEIVRAINKILEGGQYISENVGQLLVNEYKTGKNKNIRNLLNDLSDREYFVLMRLSAGETVTDISKSLSLSVKTISTYRMRIMKKLNLKNTVQLLEFMKENKL